jgi:hypothetical protein
MTQHATARKAVRAAALLAAAGLALAGCKSSTSASGTASSPAAGGSSSGPASSSASSGTGGSGGTSSAGTTYFPAAVGNTWVYQTTISGVSHGTITNKITAVTPVAGGKKVTMQILTGTGTATTVSYIFHSDGSISVPLTQFGGTAIKVTSGSIIWPSAADLSSGQPHTSTLTFELTIAGQVTHETAHVTVQGKGTHSVTVPAGTYQAQVIDETVSEKVEGVAVSLTVETWVANGVGPVKSELLSKTSTAGTPTTVEVLKSFTKG